MRLVSNKLIVGAAAGIFLALAIFYADGKTKISYPASGSNIPVYFELNMGQEKDPATRYVAKTNDYKMQIAADELKIALPERGSPGIYSRPISLKFENASSQASLAGMEALNGKASYFQSNNPQSWIKDIPLYEKIAASSLYPNIDLLYYDNGRRIEHDFVVLPGGNPSDITLSFSNIKKLYPSIAGDLVFETDTDRLSLTKPTAYQTIDGQKRPVPADYNIGKDLKVKLAVGYYDTALPLIIDPVLVYSGYLSGISGGQTSSMHVDASGNVYVAGSSGDVNVVKINSAGGIEYSTTFGGVNDDRGFGIDVDAFGNAYINGVTNSPDFPTVRAYQSTWAGSDDAFVAKLDPSGQNLLFSTYLGGSGGEASRSIAVNARGIVYVVGSTDSTDFPTLNGYQSSLQGAQDVFVSQLDPDSSLLLYSTYLGGSGNDSGADIHVGASGNVYVAGTTDSTNFPTTLAAFQSAPSGSDDAFVIKIDRGGTSLIYSTYLGGSGTERTESLTVDARGNAYVTGATESSNFPLSNALDSQFSGVADAFVTKLAATGSTLVYSTYLGGSSRESGLAIATDIDGNTYVAGITNSDDLIVVDPLQSVRASGSNDAFISKINAVGSAFFYSTYLGGTGNDRPLGMFADTAGSLFTVGTTDSIDFPVVLPIVRSGSFFISKIDPALIAQSESISLAEGASGTVEVLPVAGNAGISALVTNRDDGVDGSVNVTVSRLLSQTRTISLIDMGGNYFDIKAERADQDDTVAVSLYYPNTVVGAAEEALNILYYDGIEIEAWQPLRSSGGVNPTKDTTDNLDGTVSGGKFTFALDNTSSPKITNLNRAVIGSELIDQSVSATILEGATNTVSILPTDGKAGISAIVNNVESASLLTVRVARFSSNPGTSDIIDIGGGYVDLKIEGADSNDIAAVQLYYPSTVRGASEASIGLQYFDSVTWQPLRGSGNSAPLKDPTDNLDRTISGGRFSFTLDNTSSLRVTELSGTVITASSVPETPPPIPPPAITIDDLIKKVESLANLKKGDQKKLIKPLHKAQKELEKDKEDKKGKKDGKAHAIKHLNNFIKKVEKMADKNKLDQDQADLLIDWARQIIVDLKP